MQGPDRFAQVCALPPDSTVALRPIAGPVCGFHGREHGRDGAGALAGRSSRVEPVHSGLDSCPSIAEHHVCRHWPSQERFADLFRWKARAVWGRCRGGSGGMVLLESLRDQEGAASG